MVFPNSSEERGSESKLLVLVADDSDEAERLVGVLRARGYAVGTSARSGLATRLAAQAPALVIVDVDPEGIGAELPAGVPVIGLVAPGPGLERAQQLIDAAGGESYQRPVDVYSVLKRVEALIGRPDGSRLGSLPPPRSSIPTTRGATSSIPSLPAPVPLGRRQDREMDPGVALSPEVERLLATAELRVRGALRSDRAHTPTDDDPDAALPEQLLSALDEPLGSEPEEDVHAHTSEGLRTGTGSPSRRAPATERPGAGTSALPRRWDTQDDILAPAPPSSKRPEALLAPARPDAFTPRLPPSPGVPWDVAIHVPSVPLVVDARRTTSDAATAPSSPRPPSAALKSSKPPVPEIPRVLGPEDTIRVVGSLVRARYTGAVALEADDGIRRIVFREGDFVTAASSVGGESLVDFLRERGALTQELAASASKHLPPFGRHAGAALIARGHLRQDELWPVLRAHAEWLLSRALVSQRGAASLEEEVPARLRNEPAVFGGATGSEVLVELVRRAVSPPLALIRLGGGRTRFTDGPDSALLSECGLPEHEVQLVNRAKSVPLDHLSGPNGVDDFVCVLYALSQLGVLLPLAPPAPKAEPSVPAPVDLLDAEAIRRRVQARKALVEEGDYFALLGLPRGATAYDIRRAYEELRNEMDPRHLPAANADLLDDTVLIVEVLDEAFDVLADPVRRERYRRALDAAPH